ncbi:MAG: glycosyltransferase family 4 protein [Chitinophagales bacterium]
MFRKLNIGVVANTAFNIFNFRLELIKALKNAGHRVVAIAPKDNYVDLLLENNIEFIALKKLSRKGTNPVNDLMLVNELRTIYKKNRLDVVLQYTIKPNIYGTLAAKLSGTKTICTVTGLGYTFLNKNLTAKIAHQLYRFAFKNSNKVLFQNTDDLQVFVDFNLVDKAKCDIIPGSGIDVEKFHPDFCQNRFVPRDDTTRFLMIGRLLKDKGIFEYIEAAQLVKKQFPQTAFHVLGEIDTQNPSAIKKEQLDNWIKDNVIVYHEHTKDTRPFICAADCVVLPSYREGMPRVILEGMAMGKPCITTDAPGCKDSIIDGESGFLCKTADSRSLADVLQKFVSLNKKNKQELSINARKRAENIFSSVNINARYLDLLQKL